MSWGYVAKASRIYVTTLTAADTWYTVLSAANAKGIRGVRVKSRYKFNSSGAPTNVPAPFDMALSSAPSTSDSVTDGTGYISNDGSGFSDMFGAENGLYCRSAKAGVILEVMCFD